VISGALYSGEPTGSDESKSNGTPYSDLNRVAKPKSQSFKSNFLSIKIFSGLISRCAKPSS